MATGIATDCGKRIVDDQIIATLNNNLPRDGWRAISLNELQALTGLDAFPTLPQAVKDRAMSLPEPAGRRHKRTSSA